MKPTRSLLVVATLLSVAALPASAIPPKSFVAAQAESYAANLIVGEYGQLPDQFYSPESLALDSAGNVWVADTSNHRVTEYSPQGAYLYSFGAFGSGNGQLNAPKGIAIDTQRNLIWVSDTGNNRVQKFNMKGQFQCSVGSVSAPRGLSVRLSNGNVWVANAGIHSITRLTTACGSTLTIGGFGSGDAQFSTPLDTAQDSAGNVYVTDYNNSRVQKFNQNGVYQSQFGVAGSGDSRFTASPQFSGAGAIDIDAAGDLFVTDYSNSRIQKFTPEGVPITLFGWPGPGKGQVDHPIGIAVDGAGSVWVADTNNHRIERFAPSKSDQSPLLVNTWGTSGAGTGQFNVPTSAAVDPATGNVFVVDQNNARIQVFDAAGNFIFNWGSNGSGDGQFSTVNFIAIDPTTSEVYTTEYSNHRVQKFTSAGGFIRKWGGLGTANGLFTNPYGIAVDPATHDVWVADTNNHRMQRFTKDGVFVMGIGSGTTWTGPAPTVAAGNLNSQFNQPLGVTVASNGDLFVTDYGNNRVQKFDTNGDYLLRFGTGGAGASKGQFNAPEGIAVDPDGDVYVVNTNNHRIDRFRSNGQFVSTWSSFGSLPGQHSSPEAIALTPNGNVQYVVDRGNNRIQRFERFGFTASGAPATRTIVKGASTTYTLTSKLDGSNLNNNKVTLKVLSGLPNGATASFAPTQVKPTGPGVDSVLTVTTLAATTAKTYKIFVEVEGGGQTRIVPLTLKVTAP